MCKLFRGDVYEIGLELISRGLCKDDAELATFLLSKGFEPKEIQMFQKSGSVMYKLELSRGLILLPGGHDKLSTLKTLRVAKWTLWISVAIFILAVLNFPEVIEKFIRLF